VTFAVIVTSGAAASGSKRKVPVLAFTSETAASKPF